MGLKFQSHVQFILEFWSYIVLYRCSTENLFPIVYGTRILVTCSITSNLVPCSIDWNFDPMYNWELGLKIQSHEHGVMRNEGAIAWWTSLDSGNWVSTLLSRLLFGDGCLSINVAWECIGVRLDVCGVLYRETRLTATTEWAWRPNDGDALWVMELPLRVESVWRTVDGVEKDQEADFFGQQDRCREEGFEEGKKKGREEEASLTRRSLD